MEGFPKDFKEEFAFFRHNYIFGRIIRSLMVIEGILYQGTPSDFFFIHVGSGNSQRFVLYIGNSSSYEPLENYHFLEYNLGQK